MQKNHTTFILILSILSVIICVGSFVFFLRVIRNKNQHSSNILSVLENKMAEKDNATILNKKLNEVQSVSGIIDKHFVDSAHINKYVDYLEEFGLNNKTELVVKNVEISPSVPNTIKVMISVRGTFEDVVQTLAMLEKDDYIISIVSMYLNKDIAPTDSNGIPGVTSSWQADISFNVLSS